MFSSSAFQVIIRTSHGNSADNIADRNFPVRPRAVRDRLLE